MRLLVDFQCDLKQKILLLLLWSYRSRKVSLNSLIFIWLQYVDIDFEPLISIIICKSFRKFNQQPVSDINVSYFTVIINYLYCMQLNTIHTCTTLRQQDPYYKQFNVSGRQNIEYFSFVISFYMQSEIK